MESIESLIMETPDGKPVQPSANIQWNMDKDIPVSISDVSLGGLVLVEKVNELLNAMLQAWESKLKLDKLKEYSNSLAKKQNLNVNQHLIRDTQSTLEGPLARRLLKPKAPRKPNVEAIQVVSSSMERGSKTSKNYNRNPIVLKTIRLMLIILNIPPKKILLLKKRGNKMWEQCQ